MKNSPAHVLLSLFSCKLSVANLALTLTAFALTAAPAAIAQDGNRWYQIEVTVFAHENSNTQQEKWPGDNVLSVFPDNTRELDSLLNHLTLDDWTVLQPPAAANPADTAEPTDDRSEGPAALRSSDYRLPDALRDAFVALPASDHDFTQTNRALTESAAYRILYHNAWRQPVMRADGATPIAIFGGREFGDRHELEGTLTIRFNQSRDRVLLDTQLRLNRFTVQAPDSRTGQEQQQDIYFVSDVFPMRDSRAMRSNEFHYLDHPALGVLVQVFPYEPPAAPVTEFPGSPLPL